MRPGQRVGASAARDVFLTRFKQAIQKGGAISVMASYNEIDGVPSHANKWLLRDVLRKEWGFKGYVVSDYYRHPRVERAPGIVRQSPGRRRQTGGGLLRIKAGVNIELPEPDCYSNIWSSWFERGFSRNRSSMNW